MKKKARFDETVVCSVHRAADEFIDFCSSFPGQQRHSDGLRVPAAD